FSTKRWVTKMGFLERFAKLKSRIKNNGSKFTIDVYDDELDTNSPVMWLDARIITGTEMNYLLKNIEKDYDIDDINEIVYVDIVDFDDKIFFKLSQSRQDHSATVLLRKFISHYKENYDKSPVVADFQNFSLQEKFVSAVNKGIFPEESLALSEFI